MLDLVRIGEELLRSGNRVEIIAKTARASAQHLSRQLGKDRKMGTLNSFSVPLFLSLDFNSSKLYRPEEDRKKEDRKKEQIDLVIANRLKP
ncbi:MAG: hypothetical protein IT423_20475 [Pirellulaceae bacterium]|nr:hypothetical protein [Pirellulaceae bacterium]